MADLTGKSCFVTGGSRGIGREIALELGRHGGTVAVGYHTDDIGHDHEAHANEVSAEIAAAGGQAYAIGCDVRDPASIHAAIAQRRRTLRQCRRPRQQRRDHPRSFARQDVARGVGFRRRDEPVERLPRDCQGAAAYGRGTLRPHRQHQLGGRPARQLTARRTTPPRKPGSSASPRPRRSSSPARASRSMRSRPASSRRR